MLQSRAALVLPPKCQEHFFTSNDQPSLFSDIEYLPLGTVEFNCMGLQLIMENGSSFGAITSTAISASSSCCTPNLLVLATVASQFPTGHHYDLHLNLLDLLFYLNIF
jgi:hypothetical protein